MMDFHKVAYIATDVKEKEIVNMLLTICRWSIWKRRNINRYDQDYNQGLACGPAILWRVYTLFWLARYITHKMLFESLILGITNKNLRPNKSSPWFIILLINHRPPYQQRMKSCMNLNFVYLCCINILMCVISTCLLYLLVHDVVSILYMILCLFFAEKKERKKKMEKKRENNNEKKKSMKKKKWWSAVGEREEAEKKHKKKQNKKNPNHHWFR